MNLSDEQFALSIIQAVEVTLTEWRARQIMIIAEQQLQIPEMGKALIDLIIRLHELVVSTSLKDVRFRLPLILRDIAKAAPEIKAN